MKRSVVCLLLALTLCTALTLCVSADIVEPQPEPEMIDTLSNMELWPVLLTVAAVLAVSAVALVLILVLVKKKK